MSNSKKISPIVDYYNNYNEDERFLQKHSQVEYLTTLKYIYKYLEPNMKVLEIGAGTGHYSRALAKQGYIVDAVELVERNIDIFKSRIEPNEKITIFQGDAVDLSAFNDEVYDMTLLLGPMYHLFGSKDKHSALSEALRVTKKGGVLFVSYCIGDASILNYGFLRKNIHTLLEKDMIDEIKFKPVSKVEDIFELYRKEDIDELISSYNVARLHYIATDLYSRYDFIRDCIDEMKDKDFELYLKYHYFLCERPDIVGITHHSLDILRKGLF